MPESGMPNALPVETYLQTIETSSARMASVARALDPTTPIPTCPTWTLAELVGHQGGVQRWATAQIRGTSGAQIQQEMSSYFEAPTSGLAEWLSDGVETLVAALRDPAAADAGGVFLKDPPPAPVFWARRQAHETTIHAVDADAARLGRPPAAAQTGIDPMLAADGLDELLTGFLPRRTSRLRSPEPVTIAVVPDDSDQTWTVGLSTNPPVTTRGRGPADATLTGTAVELYLGLWNRGDELRAAGRADVLDLWRAEQRVRW